MITIQSGTVQPTVHIEKSKLNTTEGGQETSDFIAEVIGEAIGEKLNLYTLCFGDTLTINFSVTLCEKV